MEYQSPFGSYFRITESPINRENDLNESGKKSLPKGVFLDSEGSGRNRSPFQNWRNQKRNSSDRNCSFDSDQESKWRFPSKHTRRVRDSRLPSILDYYHPSMMEDPWKNLEEKLSEGKEYCSSEEHSEVNKERKETELQSGMPESQ